VLRFPARQSKKDDIYKKKLVYPQNYLTRLMVLHQINSLVVLKIPVIDQNYPQNKIHYT